MALLASNKMDILQDLELHVWIKKIFLRIIIKYKNKL